MASEDTPRPSRFRWLLIGSLAVNVLVLALIVGAVLHGPPAGRMGFVPGLWDYARALPEPYRRSLGRTLRENRRDWAGTRQALQMHRAAIGAALTADPFEIDQVETLLAEERRLTEELVDRGTRMLLDQVEAMSTEDRAAYATALMERRRRRFEHGRDR